MCFAGGEIGRMGMGDWGKGKGMGEKGGVMSLTLVFLSNYCNNHPSEVGTCSPR